MTAKILADLTCPRHSQRMLRTSAIAPLGLLAFSSILLVACSNPEAKTPVAPTASANAAEPVTPAAAPLPPGTVRRADVDKFLMRGPGWLLGRVQIEEVIRQNKFVGWRLAAFPAEWDSSGLQPGDVIVDINGVMLEKPDDLWSSWLAVADATEVRIAYERDGKPSSTVISILGAPTPDTRRQLEAGTMETPTTREASNKTDKRFETKVIGGDSGEPNDVSEF